MAKYYSLRHTEWRRQFCTLIFVLRLTNLLLKIHDLFLVVVGIDMNFKSEQSVAKLTQNSQGSLPYISITHEAGIGAQGIYTGVQGQQSIGSHSYLRFHSGINIMHCYTAQLFCKSQINPDFKTDFPRKEFLFPNLASLSPQSIHSCISGMGLLYFKSPGLTFEHL